MFKKSVENRGHPAKTYKMVAENPFHRDHFAIDFVLD